MVFPYKGIDFRADIPIGPSWEELANGVKDDTTDDVFMSLFFAGKISKTAFTGEYNLPVTSTGRFSSSDGHFNIANTPKSGPSPALRYVDGRLHVEGHHGPDVWAGTLGYADKGTTAVKLTLADRRCDGSYAIELKEGTPFGFGDGMDTRMFGVFLGVDEVGSVAWLVANDSPDHAVFCGFDVRKERHERRMPPMEFMSFGDRPYLLSPQEKHNQDVSGMINNAMYNYRRAQSEPVPMEPVATAGRPVGMFSSAHPHAFEIPSAAPVKKKPFCDIGPAIHIEVRRTKGGVERANFALKALRMIAARARKGTPWVECAKGEPEALLAEYRLGLRIEDNSSGRLLGIHDKMTSHFDLYFSARLQAATLPPMLDSIESIKDFT